MRQTIITCDRCGKVVEDQNAIYRISIHVQYTFAQSDTILHRTEWCRPCLEAVGIYNPPPEKVKECYKQPTFEDMLRELIVNMVEECK